MGVFELKADVRTDSGKEKAKKLRQQGRFPAIVYGAGKDPVSLSLDIRDAELVLGRIHGEKVLVGLQYGSDKDNVFVRNVQRDPVVDKLLHIDFFRVDMSKEMDTRVPLISIGVPAGVKLGGLLEHGVRELAIRCLPGIVPPHIEVAVEHLEVGQSVHVRDLPPIEGVKVTTAPDTVLFLVAAKQKEDDAPVGAAAPAAAAAPAKAASAAKGAAPAAKAAPAAAKAPAKKK